MKRNVKGLTSETEVQTVQSTEPSTEEKASGGSVLRTVLDMDLLGRFGQYVPEI